MDVVARLEALAAAPKVWRCISIFSDGKVRTHDQPTKAMAEGHATRQRRFLDKVVATVDGKNITLDIVEVQYIGNDWAVAAEHLGCTVAELKAYA
ncbi:hypothetical protein [Mesorhizobium opportunistum]|uniref:Uncharacterized protein n=1 Tax=Mesorhizobium opportunistum (strain LMG 24607 / HAMBI 3007 / WSM2075) TaxID=536019 RepID=F7XZW6_MESOW|nr:hypothetical protein [Mesorhizobium opportunistum]AEH88180.1 hypothetical protein Mesop_3738 [Mesorhizobium opportunistum WSM2075]